MHCGRGSPFVAGSRPETNGPTHVTLTEPAPAVFWALLVQ